MTGAITNGGAAKYFPCIKISVILKYNHISLKSEGFVTTNPDYSKLTE